MDEKERKGEGALYLSDLYSPETASRLHANYSQVDIVTDVIFYLHNK